MEVGVYVCVCVFSFNTAERKLSILSDSGHPGEMGILSPKELMYATHCNCMSTTQMVYMVGGCRMYLSVAGNQVKLSSSGTEAGCFLPVPRPGDFADH